MDLFFAAVFFIASTRLQLHAAWKSAYISFSVEKRMVTSNGSNIQLLTMLSAKPGKQKKLYKGMFGKRGLGFKSKGFSSNLN